MSQTSLFTLPNGKIVPSWWCERGWANSTDSSSSELTEYQFLPFLLDTDKEPTILPAPLDLARTRNIVKVLLRSAGFSLASDLIRQVMGSNSHACYDYKLLDLWTEVEIIHGRDVAMSDRLLMGRANSVIELAPKWAPGYYRLGQLHSLRLHAADSVRYFAMAATLEPANEVYEHALARAIEDLPSNMEWNAKTRMTTKTPDRESDPNIVHPPMRAVRFGKIWYENHNSTYPNVGERGDGILYTLPPDVRPCTYRYTVLVANNLMRLGIENIKAVESFTPDVRRALHQRMIDDFQTSIHSNGGKALERHLVAEMFPHCLSNLSDSLVFGHAISTIAQGFNMGLNNCYLEAARVDVTAMSDLSQVKHDAQRIQEAIHYNKARTHSIVCAKYLVMYGSVEQAEKHQRGNATQLFGYDNIGTAEAFVARSPMDTVTLLLHRLDEDIAWCQSIHPALTLEEAESEAWEVMKIQVSYVWHNVFVLGALLTIMNHLEQAESSLSWCTDFMSFADERMSPHLSSEYTGGGLHGVPVKIRGVSFMPSFRRGALLLRQRCADGLFQRNIQIPGNRVNYTEERLQRVAIMYRILYGHHRQECSNGEVDWGTSGRLNSHHYTLHVRSTVAWACATLGSWANSLSAAELEGMKCGLNPLNTFSPMPLEYISQQYGLSPDCVDFLFSQFGCNPDLMNDEPPFQSKVNRFALGAHYYKMAAGRTTALRLPLLFLPSLVFAFSSFYLL